MTERFKRAYDLLVKAYYNEDLMAGECTACAVGNICGGSTWVGEINALRNRFLMDGVCYGTLYGPQLCEHELIAITGYSVKELHLIERAFEQNTKIKHHHYTVTPKQVILEDQFNGLKAVLEVMLKLDGLEDSTGQLVGKFKGRLAAVTA
jgi:hypothetical protein